MNPYTKMKKCLIIKPIVISLIFMFLFFIPLIEISGHAFKGERRIYFLDATYSMISPNNIWDASKENIKKAIQNIEDENTEIVVIAFADNSNSSSSPRWDRMEVKATDAGKNDLAKWIDNLQEPPKTTKTNLHRPLNEFVNKEMKEGKINYLFLLTDGEHELQNYNPEAIIKSWNSTTDDLTYGFLVELVPTQNGKLRDAIKAQDRMWSVQSADIDLNLVRTGNKAVYNIRNDESIEIPVYFQGNNKDILKKAVKPRLDNQVFKISKYEVTPEKLIISLSSNLDGSAMEESYDLKIEFDTITLDKTFLLNSKIDLTVLNKKERALTLPTEKIKGSADQYDAFLWSDGKVTPFEIEFPLKFSKDAKLDNSTFASFEFVNGEGNPIDDNGMVITVNGKPYDGAFRITPEDKALRISVEFDKKAQQSKYKGTLRLRTHKLNRINNIMLEGSEHPDVVEYQIKNNHSLNPLAWVFIWIGASVLASLLIWFLLIKPIKYKRFGAFRKTVLIKREGQIIGQINVNFKGARKVCFATNRVPQGKFNRIFTGKIKTFVNPNFTEKITFVPGDRRNTASAYGNGYSINPNPIPSAGKAEITNNQSKIQINLQ